MVMLTASPASDANDRKNLCVLIEGPRWGDAEDKTEERLTHRSRLLAMKVNEDPRRGQLK
jgi:hypothetical protein